VQVVGIAHSHRFSAGSRIRVELTNIDREIRPEWGDTPFVLPLFMNTSATLYLDSARSASLVFPIVGEAPLPIVLASFVATPSADGASVLLRWKTLSESNNYGFYVERREEGSAEFLSLGFVPPQAGPNSIVPLDYAYRDTLARAGTFWYRLRQIDLDGASSTSEPLRVELASATLPVLQATVLEQNYPNPFNPVTALRFTLPRAVHLRLDIVDVTGRVVATLVEGELPAGDHVRLWDGSGVASGVYYARLQAGSARLIRPMVLMR
jgi:hypothetical protein